MKTEFTIKDNQVTVEMDRTNVIKMDEKSILFERIYNDADDNAVELSWEELFDIIYDWKK